MIPFGSSKTAPGVRRKRYEVEIIGEGAAVTELYITGYKNHFLKIRATYPARSTVDALARRPLPLVSQPALARVR